VIAIGTSGFSFPEWVGSFYPEGTKDGSAMLSLYSRYLDTVEVNYTFRHHPSSATLASWRKAVPADFRLTLKAHQSITHRARLKDAADTAGLFFERSGELGEALGAVLFQLPPQMKADPERLRGFCGALPVGLRARAAFEFRHPSWFDEETYEILREAGCSLVLAETDECEPVEQYPARLVYIRLRRESYGDEDLRRWSVRLFQIATDHDVFCYVKHELDAPQVALRLKAMLADLGSAEQA
jgi:uncharacterized protein YecE (DUF72 family)